MKTVWFHMQGYRDLPDDFSKRYESVWVTPPNQELCRSEVVAKYLKWNIEELELADELGFELGTPRDASRRGSHVSVRHPDAWRICRALIERAGVVPDFRAPDSVRLGLSPGYTRFTDVWDAVDAIRRVVTGGLHMELAEDRSRVT